LFGEFSRISFQEVTGVLFDVSVSAILLSKLVSNQSAESFMPLIGEDAVNVLAEARRDFAIRLWPLLRQQLRFR
jgi:hypothetical protein